MHATDVSKIDFKNKTESYLQDYLSGYTRGNNIRLDEILKLYDWRKHAHHELANRQHKLLQSLDIETLTAIADGLIDIHEVARRIKYSRDETTL